MSVFINERQKIMYDCI